MIEKIKKKVGIFFNFRSVPYKSTTLNSTIYMVFFYSDNTMMDEKFIDVNSVNEEAEKSKIIGN